MAPPTKKRKRKSKPNEERSIFAIRLGEALKAKRMVRRDLAEGTKINIGTINSWFNPGAGFPNFKAVIDVAAFLGASLDYLAGTEGADSPDDAQNDLVDAIIERLASRLTTPKARASRRPTAGARS